MEIIGGCVIFSKKSVVGCSESTFLMHLIQIGYQRSDGYKCQASEVTSEAELLFDSGLKLLLSFGLFKYIRLVLCRQKIILFLDLA